MADMFEEPAGNASTEAWQAYARQQAPDKAEEIDGMTRNELRDAYGTPTPDPAEDGEPAATPDNPGQDPEPSNDTAATDDTPQPQSGVGFENVMPPVPTAVPDVDMYRVSLHSDRWDVDAVEFPYGDPGDTVRISKQAPLTVPEAEADALIQAAGERGFALTKEKIQ